MPPPTTADEGGDRYRGIVVKLSADPERDFVRIPFTTTLQGGAVAEDYDIPRSRERINANDETEAEFRFAALDDTDEDHGESVRLSFGTPLPERA